MTNTIKKHLTKVNKGKAGTNDPEFIVFHFVGASGQAMGNAEYFEEVYRGSSAHYFVDPKTIVQVVEDTTPAWHIGDGVRTRKGTINGHVHSGGATNTNSIGIEVCQDTTTGKDAWSWGFHPDTLDKVEWLINTLQKKYNIDDDHVIRHYDATGKICPGNWKDNDWAKWWEFKKRLKSNIVQPKSNATPKSDGKLEDKDTYLVETGDTLYSIATVSKVSVAELVKWNKLKDEDMIFPESRLIVKPPVVVKPKAKATSTTVTTKSVDQLAHEVIDGKHGSGDTRKKALGSLYDKVQVRVNQLLGAKSKPTVKSIDTLVKEVMRGEHGSGRERMVSLGTRYAEVQKEVNRRSR